MEFEETHGYPARRRTVEPDTSWFANSSHRSAGSGSSYGSQGAPAPASASALPYRPVISTVIKQPQAPVPVPVQAPVAKSTSRRIGLAFSKAPSAGTDRKGGQEVHDYYATGSSSGAHCVTTGSSSNLHDSGSSRSKNDSDDNTISSSNRLYSNSKSTASASTSRSTQPNPKSRQPSYQPRESVQLAPKRMDDMRHEYSCSHLAGTSGGCESPDPVDSLSQPRCSQQDSPSTAVRLLPRDGSQIPGQRSGKGKYKGRDKHKGKGRETGKEDMDDTSPVIDLSNESTPKKSRSRITDHHSSTSHNSSFGHVSNYGYSSKGGRRSGNDHAHIDVNGGDGETRSPKKARRDRIRAENQDEDHGLTGVDVSRSKTSQLLLPASKSCTGAKSSQRTDSASGSGSAQQIDSDDARETARGRIGRELQSGTKAGLKDKSRSPVKGESDGWTDSTKMLSTKKQGQEPVRVDGQEKEKRQKKRSQLVEAAPDLDLKAGLGESATPTNTSRRRNEKHDQTTKTRENDCKRRSDHGSDDNGDTKINKKVIKNSKPTTGQESHTSETVKDMRAESRQFARLRAEVEAKVHKTAGDLFFDEMRKERAMVVNDRELGLLSDIERALNRETIREPVEDDDLETSPKSVSAVEAIAQSRLSQEVINCLKDAEGDEKCRYCGKILPVLPSDYLVDFKLSLVGVGQQDSGGGATSFISIPKYCQAHLRETTTIPLGIRAGYPTEIDFTNIYKRLEGGWIKTMLRMMIKRPAISTIYRMHCEDIVEYGQRQWNTNHAQLLDGIAARVMPGYYGSIGTEIIKWHFQNLRDWKYLTIDENLTHPITPTQFISRVLVPEAAILLIMDDRNMLPNDPAGPKEIYSAVKAAYPEAEQVRKQSVEFGKYHFRGDDAYAEEVLVQWRRDSESRKAWLSAKRRGAKGVRKGVTAEGGAGARGNDTVDVDDNRGIVIISSQETLDLDDSDIASTMSEAPTHAVFEDLTYDSGTRAKSTTLTHPTHDSTITKTRLELSLTNLSKFSESEGDDSVIEIVPSRSKRKSPSPKRHAKANGKAKSSAKSQIIIPDSQESENTTDSSDATPIAKRRVPAPSQVRRRRNINTPPRPSRSRSISRANSVISVNEPSDIPPPRAKASKSNADANESKNAAGRVSARGDNHHQPGQKPATEYTFKSTWLPGSQDERGVKSISQSGKAPNVNAYTNFTTAEIKASSQPRSASQNKLSSKPLSQINILSQASNDSFGGEFDDLDVEALNTTLRAVESGRQWRG